VPDEEPQYCARCGEPLVVPDAAYCKACGAAVTSLHGRPAGFDRGAAIAAGLSIVPGLGHLHRGRPFAAGAWFLGVLFFYHLGPVGFLVHLACAANAALGGASARRMRRRRRFSGDVGLRAER